MRVKTERGGKARTKSTENESEKVKKGGEIWGEKENKGKRRENKGRGDVFS